MDRSKWFARLALAAATVGVLAAAGLGSGVPYDYPQGDNSVIALFPESAVYYSRMYMKDASISEYYYAYDAEDRIVSSVTMREDGTVWMHTNRYYDAAGNEIAAESIEHETGEVDRWERFYNADGDLESIEQTNSATGETRFTEYAYDEQDRVIWYRIKEANGEIVEASNEYEMLDTGGWIQETTGVRRKANGVPQQFTQYFECDAQGNTIYSRYSGLSADVDGELWHQYEYDTDGNVIRYASLDGPDGPISFEDTSVYENGLLIETTSRMPRDDGTEYMSRTVYTYNEYGHKVLAEEWHNTDGETSEIITDYYLT